MASNEADSIVNQQSLQLPDSIVSYRDIHICLHELEQITEDLTKRRVKTRLQLPFKSEAVAPSQLLQDLIQLNNLPLNSPQDVDALRQQLENWIQFSPRLDFYFAAEPNAALRQRIVAWVRANIRQDVLVDIHVTSGLAGGFVVETPHRRYDFSWRTYLQAQQRRIIDLIRKSQNQAA